MTMPKEYDLFKVKLFLDSIAQCHDEKVTENNLTSIEQQLKTCLSTEQALFQEISSNKREIIHIEEELKKIESWHNELLQHPDLSSEKKQQMKERIEQTKTKLQNIKQQF